MEGAWVLPVRMCYRRDAIPPISYSSCVIVEMPFLRLVIIVVRYILTVCLPMLDFCTILYVINSVHVVLGSDFAI